jgi:hypothetical protein
MIAGVIVPGRGYGPQAPLLDLAGEALADLDAAAETVTWTGPDDLLDIGPEPFVRSHVLAALHRLAKAAPGTQPVINDRIPATTAAAANVNTAANGCARGCSDRPSDTAANRSSRST